MTIGAEGHSRVALVADIGRKAMRIGLTDEAGRLRHDSVRAYDPSVQSTLSGAMGTFRRDAGLVRLPSRCAIAVSGIPRGDVISITHSRWYISRSGLTAMLQAPPLILNDFAANAWAISDPRCSGRMESLSGRAVTPHAPGSYCIIGIGSGLGVALLSRDEHGSATVVPTEAGHSLFMAGMPGAEQITPLLRSKSGYLAAESMISASGIMAIYQAFATLAGVQPVVAEPADLLRLGTTMGDATAARALDFFARALWHFAGNLVLAYGAWDGVILTGSVVAALRPALRRPTAEDHFVINGPYMRQLREVPRSTISFEHAELEGAAVALLVDESRRNFAAGTLPAAA
jgi:glucokinase